MKNLKKTFYIFLTMVATVVFSVILHVLIEKWYLNWTEERGITPVWTFGCSLPLWLNWGLTLAALIGGYFLGRYWWRIVYEEKRGWKIFKK